MLKSIQNTIIINLSDIWNAFTDFIIFSQLEETAFDWFEWT